MFDELCDNYSMERLQMLFHNSTFTAAQDRYIQEEIQVTFSDVALSPLPVIDVIDKAVHMVSRDTFPICQILHDSTLTVDKFFSNYVRMYICTYVCQV